MTQETHEFKTEVRQILDLMIHSLYSHKEIFLRELISNASDALDKLRYEAQTRPDLLEDEPGLGIRIIADKASGTLTVSDNGIGMGREEAVRELGTIARSGTREFLASLKDSPDMKGNPELIGQFGVGFYSSFMVADRVTVVSRRAGGDEALRWESSADGSYTVDETAKPSRGTDVILHLNEEGRQYLQEHEIREIVRKYSDYIEHPIVMEVEREEVEGQDRKTVRRDETLNSQKAIWLKNKAEVTDEEYAEFYRHVSHDFTEPGATIHFKSEGTSEFSALLYIPEREPFGIFYKDYKTGPTLYVRRVQIMRNCEELLPQYLRFVKGVVDSSDLPLNVSRELLQSNRQISVIRKGITKRILDTLSLMKKNEYEKYAGLHEAHGRVLKEGLHFDYERREAIAALLLFRSTATGADRHTSLDDYLDAMKPDQKEIYYITGVSVEEAMKSPYVEAFRSRGIEVLVLPDEVDDILMGGLHEYKGKGLKSVTRGDVDLGDGADKGMKEQASQRYSRLIDLIKGALKDEVEDVRLSGRLTDSACCLVAAEGGMDPKMEHIFKAMGQEVPHARRILELNPEHPLTKAMQEAFETSPEDPMLPEYAGLLYDQALLLEGSRPRDAAEFSRRLTLLMARAAAPKPGT